eukprot:8525867-Pyramimonas_sp.AAC.1
MPEGPLGAVLDPFAKKEEVLNSDPPIGGSKVPSWFPFGPHLARSWGRRGAMLDPSWGYIGDLGSILRPQGPIGSEQAKNIGCP